MEKLTDLRLIIGLFFSISGIILLLNYFIIPDKHPELNLYSGLAMLIFGLLMLLFYYKGSDDNA